MIKGLFYFRTIVATTAMSNHCTESLNGNKKRVDAHLGLNTKYKETSSVLETQYEQRDRY